MSLRPDKKQIVALLLILVYVAAATIGLLREQMWELLLPLACAAIALCVLRLEETLIFIAFCTPFAVDMALFEGMELSLPTEPLMILFSAVFMFRVLVVKGYDKALLRHPVTVVLLISLTWMLVTALFSQDVAVSLKYWAARLWFVIPFFFGATMIFQGPRRI